MADRIVVDFHALHHASEQIGLALRSMNSELEELERAAAPLVETWSGASKEAYAERQHKWRTAASDIATMLGQIKRAVDDSAADFANTETRNTNLFR
jgi:WXG100 family type VII secretion target